MTTRRSVLMHSAAALAALALPRGAAAQAFPTKPIKIIVPFPPGGPADTAVRIAQPGMEKALGTAVFFGMLGVTLFGLLFTPVFYVVVRWIGQRRSRPKAG